MNKNKSFLDVFFDIVRDFNQVRKDERMVRAMSYSGIGVSRQYKGFKNLTRRGLIKETKTGCAFTTSGKLWFQKTKLKYFRLRYPKWDKRWRIVIFDVPQELHRQRNNFRNKLLALGFYMLQKSVFILPYPCEEELGDICKDIGVHDYVDLIVAETVGFKESELKKHFDL